MEDNWWIAIGYEPMWVNMKIYPKLIQLCDPTGSGVPGLQGAVPSCFWTRQPCSWEPGNLGISIFLRCILFRSKLCQGTSVDPHLAWWACTTKWALGSDRNSGNFSRNKLSYAVSSSKSWNWIEAVAWHFSGTGFWQPPLRCQYSDSCTIVVLRHARKKKRPQGSEQKPCAVGCPVCDTTTQPIKASPKRNQFDHVDHYFSWNLPFCILLGVAIVRI